MSLAGRYPNLTSVRSEKKRRKRETPENVEPPKMPSDLPSGAKAIWRTLIPQLVRAAVPLRRVDAAVIAAYCTCLAQAHEMEQLAETEAAISQKVKLLRFAKALRRDAVAYGDRLGVSPASRLRLGVANLKPPRPDNPWANI